MAREGYYGWDKNNFGPHVSFAYSPHADGGFLHKLFGDGDKTVVRGGFGVVFDHIGPGLVNTFDSNGSFGLTTQLSNVEVPSVSSAPRITGLNTLPSIAEGFPAQPRGPPFTPPPGGTGLAIFWGLDDTIKSPYSYSVDFSIGRELPHNIGFEVSYVGRYLAPSPGAGRPGDATEHRGSIVEGQLLPGCEALHPACHRRYAGGRCECGQRWLNRSILAKHSQAASAGDQYSVM